ncbi:porin family protein [Akkermansiaceae bacterium]|nr:porin family protein [Akkermansiaceae bacterium]
MKAKSALLASIAVLSAAPAFGLSLEELAARLEKLEKKVATYEKRYGPLEQPTTSNGPKVRSKPAPRPQPVVSGMATAEDIDQAYLREGNEGSRGGWWERTSLGGYGELHLNQGDKEQIDFHRWVLFLNHRFSDRIQFFSELELEHSLSGEGKPGEIELEQAYIEFALEQGWSVKAGQFLLPLGSLNETHEPETFFGVERNNVESNIIPTTWWEGGVGATKSFDSGVSVDVAVHSALSVSTDPTNDNAFRIRSGRQKVANAGATDYAASARVRYSGIEGLDLSIFANYQNDIAPMNAEDNSALLLGGSASYRNSGFGLKSLIGHWDIDGQSFAANDADRQWGYFAEPSYTWSLGGDQKLGVFGRYSHYEFSRGAMNAKGGEFDEYSIGVNYWPTDNVVIKADFTQSDQKGGVKNETYNFGLGYSF